MHYALCIMQYLCTRQSTPKARCYEGSLGHEGDKIVRGSETHGVPGASLSREMLIFEEAIFSCGTTRFIVQFVALISKLFFVFKI